jgi:pimeloyl-ACP methyl ester carboxylesterase
MAGWHCRLVGLVAATLLVACAAGSIGTETDAVAKQSAPLLLGKLKRACDDTIDSIYVPPGAAGSYNRGDVVRCARGRRIGTNEITEALTSRNFVGIEVLKAVKLFRITYRTGRLAGQPDFATALVALPAKAQPASPPPAIGDGDDDDEDTLKSGKRAPLVVFAHGTAPYGNGCASSKLDPLQCSETVDGDTELAFIVALATLGHPVVAPDYAGYVQGSTTAGYLLAEDEAHSVLDAARSINKLRTKSVDKVVLVGHSQGGHAVLSAQALASGYGLAGKLVGVAAMAPFWAPLRLLPLTVAGPPYDTNPIAQAFAIEYFYTGAEVRDGAGHGELLFNPDKRALLSTYVATCNFSSTSCNFINSPPEGFGLASEFFDGPFFAAVSACGFDRSQCKASPLAKTWEQRFVSDRPTLDRNGAPIVLWHGAADPVIPAPFAKCAVKKITRDLGLNKNGDPDADDSDVEKIVNSPAFSFCGDPYADHDQILSDNALWISQWITARALGEPEPTAGGCMPTKQFKDAVAATGQTFTCPNPPGNKD